MNESLKLKSGLAVAYRLDKVATATKLITRLHTGSARLQPRQTKTSATQSNQISDSAQADGPLRGSKDPSLVDTRRYNDVTMIRHL